MDVRHEEARKREQPASRPTEALQRLISSLPERPGLLLDSEGNVLACRSALPPFLPPPETLLNTKVLHIRPRVLGEALSELWQECRRSGEPAIAEILFSLDPDEQSVVSASVRGAPHPESDSTYVVTIRDVSREKGCVQTLLDRIEVLESRLQSREPVLETVGHDVLSCLAALDGFLELTLHLEDLPPAAVQNVQLAREIAARVGAIAARAARSAGEPLPKVPMVLGALAQRLFRALQAAHPDLAFTWAVHAPEVNPNLPRDVLWEVLWNLLTNSVKYRRDDRVLHVELRAGTQLGETWIEVRDNGRGIPPGEERLVFLRGRRGTNASHVQGSGIGLYSARQLLGTYGGKVHAVPCAEGAILRVTC
jgi:signal transduction histidine kinase